MFGIISHEVKEDHWYQSRCIKWLKTVENSIIVAKTIRIDEKVEINKIEDSISIA